MTEAVRDRLTGNDRIETMTPTINHDPSPSTSEASARGDEADDETSPHIGRTVADSDGESPREPSAATMMNQPRNANGVEERPRDDAGAETTSRKAGNSARYWMSSIGSTLRWALVTAACLWLALCTSLGPLYRQFLNTTTNQINPDAATIAAFGPINAALFIVAFISYLAIIIALARLGSGQRLIPQPLRRWRDRRRSRFGQRPTTTEQDTNASRRARMARKLRHGYAKTSRISQRAVLACTSSWRRLALVLLIGWLWVPVTLVSAFGADMRSQFREFSWAWNQATGLEQPYIGFFAFVPMDIYPTAHYLWPAHPTYLTDQHNFVLTLLYGATGAASRYLTGANDLGIAVLSASQFLFAVFCISATANRFFNRPWMNSRTGQTEQNSHTGRITQERSQLARKAIGPWPRFLIMAFLLTCPPVLFATISLTKSPLFAFAFAWWFGVGYELKETRRESLPRKSFAALIISTCVMLISAKYAWYIIVLMALLAFITDRHRFMTYLIGLIVPAILIHGGLALAIRSGVIIGGDPIESHGAQLQQIARIAKLDPDSIPESARRELAPIFNLDQMAEAYFQQDADPVKSSGIQSKRVSYKWRTVTGADMKHFNKAWLEIIKANPRIALDALLAKSYGYFDIQDPPYTDMTYYVNSDQIKALTVAIRDWLPAWRNSVTDRAKQLSHMKVVGWLIHGNTYVIATLLLGAAEVVLRRWRTLATHMPLLLLMGVMITSPANNFERHMLPLIFVFGFVCLTFWLESPARVDNGPSQSMASAITAKVEA